LSDNATTAKRFIDAWARLDPTELASFFAEDGIYHNMPATKITGRRAIEHFIGAFIKSWTSTRWEVATLISSGDFVVAERIDHISMGDRQIALPCCGVFEFKDGQIKIWRDYFDLQTYLNSDPG